MKLMTVVSFGAGGGGLRFAAYRGGVYHPVANNGLTESEQNFEACSRASCSAPISGQMIPKMPGS
jgi:hypothetical protein